MLNDEISEGLESIRSWEWGPRQGVDLTLEETFSPLEERSEGTWSSKDVDDSSISCGC